MNDTFRIEAAIKALINGHGTDEDAQIIIEYGHNLKKPNYLAYWLRNKKKIKQSKNHQAFMKTGLDIIRYGRSLMA